jgi:hypothetical protein
MKTLLCAVCAIAVLGTTWAAQGQRVPQWSGTGQIPHWTGQGQVPQSSPQQQLPQASIPATSTMSVQEFRQVLVDLGGYLDAHKNTNLRQQFEALTDQQLEQVLPSVQDPYALQRAVARLKEYDMRHSGRRGRLNPDFSRNSVLGAVSSYPNCSSGSIIDNSSGAQCLPAYPDPNNTAWQSLVNPLITFGAFNPTDYPDVSMQACSLTVESNLSIVVSALNGTVTVAAIACGAVPPPANIACFVPVAVAGVAGEVSQGLLNDCSEQDGYVNAAEVDAGFHNTVTIFNALGTDLTQISNDFNTVDTQIAGVSTQITNVNNQITNEFAALTATITMLFNDLSTQVTNSTDLTSAGLKQVMKLELTPDGKRAIVPAILSCTGTNCPNVLNRCPAAGCSWNNVGPLP